MTKKIANLKDLLIEQGRELYDATRKEQKELAKIQLKASSPKLKKVIARELDMSRQQERRLENAFRKLNVSPEGETNEVAGTILKQMTGFIDRTATNDVRDAALINAIQRLSHDKMTTFGSLASYAKEMDREDLAVVFHDAAEVEKEIDHELSELAEKEINHGAVAEVLL